MYATKGTPMLSDAHVATRLPAQDLDRARRFYAEKLGLEPVDQRPGGLLYRCGAGEFALFASAGASPGTFTQMAFEVEDLDAVVRALTARGVKLQEFDLPGLKTAGGVAEVAGNYPSKRASGERAAWFRDSEGNLLGVGQPLGVDRLLRNDLIASIAAPTSECPADGGGARTATGTPCLVIVNRSP